MGEIVIDREIRSRLAALMLAGAMAGGITLPVRSEPQGGATSVALVEAVAEAVLERPATVGVEVLGIPRDPALGELRPRPRPSNFWVCRAGDDQGDCRTKAAGLSR
jgi:hypothetical protein